MFLPLHYCCSQVSPYYINFYIFTSFYTQTHKIIAFHPSIQSCNKQTNILSCSAEYVTSFNICNFLFRLTSIYIYPWIYLWRAIKPISVETSLVMTGLALKFSGGKQTLTIYHYLPWTGHCITFGMTALALGFLVVNLTTKHNLSSSFLKGHCTT